MKKILVVDDHPIFLMGMKQLLNQEEDMTVSGVAEDIAGAREFLKRDRPDLAIIDISLAEENGLDLVKEITKYNSGLPVLVLSLHDESVWAERAIRAGARGYVMKKESPKSVILAIRNIFDGKIHLSPEMMTLLLHKFQGYSRTLGTPAVDELTNRELEVFNLIGSGLTTREIADCMKIAIKTVGTYRDRIKQKLHLKSASELTRKAVLWKEKEQFGITS